MDLACCGKSCGLSDLVGDGVLDADLQLGAGGDDEARVWYGVADRYAEGDVVGVVRVELQAGNLVRVRNQEGDVLVLVDGVAALDQVAALRLHLQDANARLQLLHQQGAAKSNAGLLANLHALSRVRARVGSPEGLGAAVPAEELDDQGAAQGGGGVRDAGQAQGAVVLLAASGGGVNSFQLLGQELLRVRQRLDVVEVERARSVVDADLQREPAERQESVECAGNLVQSLGVNGLCLRANYQKPEVPPRSPPNLS